MFLLVLALLGLVPAGSSAATIRVDFVGHVALVTFPTLNGVSSGADVPVATGASVVGWWSYETAAEAIDFGGQQLFLDPTTGFSFAVAGGALTLAYDGSNPPMTINVGWESSRSFDVSDHEFSGTSGSIRGTEFTSSITYSPTLRPNWVPEFASMSFTDNITGPPLPQTLNGLMWQLSYRTWTGERESTSGRLYIEPESVRFTQIPEPATLALVALGLAGLGAARGRR